MEQLTISYDSSIKEHIMWLLTSLPMPKGKVRIEDVKKNDKLLQSLKKTEGILSSKNIDPIAYQREIREDR
ncbi:MAG: hypothetical protein ACOCP1_01955 [Campylobacterales bacterium]